MLKILLTSLITLLTISCTTSPTGRKQLTLMPSGQINQMGAQSFAQLKRQKPLSRNSRDIRVVRCITERLLLAMGERPVDWEIQVFEDKSPNAFAVPGNKMGVHTGMMRLVKNQHQLAAVIGHEIGHVLANHGNERMSQGMVAQMGLGAAQIALGRDSKTDGLIVAALGLGAQFGVLLPFSRRQETESDRLGLKYMAEAGFDPRQAAELWKLMAQGGGGQPEFMSTHPSPQSRIQDLAARAPQHMAAYNSVRNKPRCM